MKTIVADIEIGCTKKNSTSFANCNAKVFTPKSEGGSGFLQLSPDIPDINLIWGTRVRIARDKTNPATIFIVKDLYDGKRGYFRAYSICFYIYKTLMPWFVYTEYNAEVVILNGEVALMLTGI